MHTKVLLLLFCLEAAEADVLRERRSENGAPNAELVAKRRQQTKQIHIDRFLSLSRKRSSAEAEAEEILATVQELKRIALRKNGITDVEPDDDGLWQGDIVLMKEDVERLLSHYDNSRAKRADSIFFEQYGNKLWQLPIPYAISDQYEPDEVQKIQRALSLVTEAVPCLNFTDATDRSGQTPYMYFAKGSGGCSGSSAVGRWEGQNAIIANMYLCNADEANRVITHELLHSLGLQHEQSRNDRDNYVTVNASRDPQCSVQLSTKSRIKREAKIEGKGQFFILINSDNIKDEDARKLNFDINPDQTSYGVKFNFKSILMYQTTAYAINDDACTICPKPGYEDQAQFMGKTKYLEPTDKEILYKMYCMPDMPFFNRTDKSDSTQQCGSNALTEGYCDDAGNAQNCAKSCAKTPYSS